MPPPLLAPKIINPNPTVHMIKDILIFLYKHVKAIKLYVRIGTKENFKNPTKALSSNVEVSSNALPNMIIFNTKPKAA